MTNGTVTAVLASFMLDYGLEKVSNAPFIHGCFQCVPMQKAQRYELRDPGIWIVTEASSSVHLRVMHLHSPELEMSKAVGMGESVKCEMFVL
jgi:hypothetical protein